MSRKSRNRSIKDYFDEVSSEEESESFLSPSSANQSATDFNASISRQPLASSSRNTPAQLRITPKRYTPKPKSKQKTVSATVDSPSRRSQSHRSRSKTLEKKSGKGSRFTNENVNFLSRRSRKSPESVEPNRNKRKQSKPSKVLREIATYQQNTNLLVPKLPFSRVIREILMDPSISSTNDLRVTVSALEALQEACEIYLTIFFEDAYRCTLHRGRVTLIVKDMELVRVLRGVSDPGYGRI